MSTATFDQVSITSDDGSALIAYVHQGAGPVVMLLHDLNCSAAYWGSVTAALLDRDPDLNLMALDLRGHGRSTCVGETSRKRLVKDLKRWCKELNLVDPILVGHGWGADIALATDFAAAVIAVNPLLGRQPAEIPLELEAHDVTGAGSTEWLTACTIGALNAKELKRSRRDAPLFLVGSQELDAKEPVYAALREVAVDWVDWQCGSRHLPLEFPIGVAALLLSWIEEH